VNIYLTLAILLVTALLQSTVLPRIALWGVHPDLVLLVVTSWSLLRGSQEGMLWALVGGLSVDLFSGARLGVTALPLLIVSFLSSLGERTVFRFDLLIPILIIPLASLLYAGAMLGMLFVLGWPVAWRDSLTHVVFPSMLVNTLSMPVIYLAMRALDRRTGREEMSW